MKTMVILAVLFASPLVVTGVAFAQADCECYKITTTGLGFSVTTSLFLKICFDYEDNLGEIYGLCDSICNPPDPLHMFFDTLNKRAYAFKVFGDNSLSGCMLNLKFHGSDLNVVTGDVLYILNARLTLWGHKVDLENCNCPG
jgi:hypothetical protein